MSLGKKFITALAQSGTVSEFLGFGKVDHLFIGNEPQVWAYVSAHIKKYATIPTVATIEAHTQQELMPAEEPPAYYLDLLKERYIELAIKKTVKESTNFLQPGNRDVEKALALMAEGVMDIIGHERSNQVHDFRDAFDLIIATYAQKMKLSDDYGLQLGWPTLDQMSGGIVKGDTVSIVGRPAAGKALAHGTPVLLADGSFKPVEDITIGDRLASVDGEPSQVFGVYAQGVRDLYCVTLADGRSLTVDGDHLWQVGCKYWDAPRVMTTLDMLRFRSKATRYANTMWLPLVSGEFGNVAPTIDPYLLGVLIGDGCLTKEVSFTSVDQHIVDRAEKGLPRGYCLTAALSGDRAPSYRVVSVDNNGRLPRNAIKFTLQQLGLWGVKSEAKFLPDVVFLWNRADRLALLQGLMDTDGTVAASGHTVFGSSSQRLADDVARLVRSLGGKALPQKVKLTTHLDHHRCTVILRQPREAFSLPRKKDRCCDYTTHDPAHLRIVDIVPAGSGLATCLAVTHTSRLFVAGDYVVTHNTWQLLYAAHSGWRKAHNNPEVNQSRLFISMEMDALPIEQRLASMQTHLPFGDLKHANFTTPKIKALKSGLKEIQGYVHPFWVAEGNLAAMVEDVWMLARQLKPGAIFIDGAYLMKHPTERDRFRRVAENANLIKQELAPLCPVVCSWQFAKSAAKKNTKKGEKVTYEDIGYSDAIAQDSSLILGLMQSDGVDTLIKRKVEILKGRNGEVGSFETYWDFKNMNFGEVVEEPLEELKFLG